MQILKKSTILFFLFFLFVFFNSVVAEDGREILLRADKILAPDTFEGEMEMTAYGSDGSSRTYRMKIYKKTKKKVLVVFFYPNIEKGRKVLRVGDDMWMYLPSVKRSIRISPKQKFLDGDFTHGDITRLDFDEDYTVQNVTEEEHAYKLELVAKNPAISYNRVRYRIRKDTYIPLSQEYFTVSGKLLKTLTLSDVKDYGSLKRPSSFMMEDSFVKNMRTVLVYKELNLKPKIPNFYFQMENLDQF